MIAIFKRDNIVKQNRNTLKIHGNCPKIQKIQYQRTINIYKKDEWMIRLPDSQTVHLFVLIK